MSTTLPQLSHNAFAKTKAVLKDLMRRPNVHHVSAWRLLPNGSSDLLVRFDVDEDTASSIDEGLSLDPRIARAVNLRNEVLSMFVVANGSVHTSKYERSVASRFDMITALLRDPRSFAIGGPNRKQRERPRERSFFYTPSEREVAQANARNQRETRRDLYRWARRQIAMEGFR